MAFKKYSLIISSPSPRPDGSESVDDDAEKKTVGEDYSYAEASDEEDLSENVSDSGSEVRDGEGTIGLAALVGADIIDEEESASDFV